MSGTWLDEFAVVYRACAQIGLANPREVDELALWEIAAILGVNDVHDDEDVAPISLNARPDPEGPTVFSAWRALARAEGTPLPGFDDRPTPAEYQRILKLIEGGRKGGGASG